MSLAMVPETIDWDLVRCVSIDGCTIRLLEGANEREIVFPSEEVLHQALRRWTIESDHVTEFFRKHDFQVTEARSSADSPPAKPTNEL